MPRQRKEKEPKIKLKQPDRSGPDPSAETLLAIAEQRGLLKIPQEEDEFRENEDEPPTGRLADSILWSISLTMLHFTLDVLVSHQYAVAISWPVMFKRAAQAFPGEPPTSQYIHHLLTNYSYPAPLLFFPPPLVTLGSPPSSPPTNTARVAPAPLLRHQHHGRVLLDPHLKYVRVLRCYEASSPSGLYVDMVRHRAGPFWGGGEFALLHWLLEIGRVCIPVKVAVR